jgi:dolichyl-diphosphooligosaccharide--protein glycosyltransferase
VGTGPLLLVLYAAGAMAATGLVGKQMLHTAPAMSLLGSVALSHLLSAYGAQLHAPAPPTSTATTTGSKAGHKAREGGRAGAHGAALSWQKEAATTVLMGLLAVLVFYMQHSVWVTKEVYAASDLVLVANMPDGSEVLYDDHREAYSWLRHNSPPDARVMAWCASPLP